MRITREVAAAVLRGAFGANRGRTAVATLAIALGVALGFAIRSVNQSAVAEFAAGVATLSGSADLVVRGPGDGFDESVYPAIARLPAVAVASPVVEVDARLPGRDETLPLAGVDGTLKKRLGNGAAAGRAHLKTGYLENVRAIAGYVLDSSDKRWVVVFLINDAKSRQGKPAMDALLRWVAER